MDLFQMQNEQFQRQFTTSNDLEVMARQLRNRAIGVELTPAEKAESDARRAAFDAKYAETAKSIDEFDINDFGPKTAARLAAYKARAAEPRTPLLSELDNISSIADVRAFFDRK